MSNRLEILRRERSGQLRSTMRATNVGRYSCTI